MTIFSKLISPIYGTTLLNSSSGWKYKSLSPFAPDPTLSKCCRVVFKKASRTKAVIMATGFSGERQFTWRAFFICLIISVGALSFGYPTAIPGTTFSQPSFLSYMKLIDEKGNVTSDAQALIGASSGVYQVFSCSSSAIHWNLLTSTGRCSHRYSHCYLGHGQVWT